MTCWNTGTESVVAYAIPIIAVPKLILLCLVYLPNICVHLSCVFKLGYCVIRTGDRPCVWIGFFSLPGDLLCYSYRSSGHARVADLTLARVPPSLCLLWYSYLGAVDCVYQWVVVLVAWSADRIDSPSKAIGEPCLTGSGVGRSCIVQVLVKYIDWISIETS